MRHAFTLMELLIVIAIIAILAALAAVGLVSAVNYAKEQRTQVVVSKIDTLIMEKWEGYRTRTLPIRPPAGVTGTAGAAYRLDALRELQRVELPERISDLCTDAELADLGADGDLDAIDHTTAKMAALTTLPSAAKAMKRLAARPLSEGIAWSDNHQGAECLFLILSTIKDGDKSALEFFTPDEIGDVDGDKRREILDGFGNPIEFLRWCPGYTKEQQAVTEQTENVEHPDPFDPLKLYSETFAIRPLIYSAGPDDQYDIAIITNVGAGVPFAYVNTTPPNDPYHIPPTARSGMPFDTNGNGAEEWVDNITNHFKTP